MSDRALRSDNGFVLIELTIVLIVLGIVAGIAMLSIAKFSSAATGSRDAVNESTCATAIAAYEVDHGGAPVTDAQLDPYMRGPATDCLS